MSDGSNILGHEKRNGLTFDKKFNHFSKRILPGDYAVVTEKDEMLTTTLGSCVAACIRDPLFGIGGMNHFLLPESKMLSDNSNLSQGTKYGNNAMELLINELLKKGCNKKRFEVKVFGGAHVGSMNVSVGKENSDFILKYIQDEGLNLLSYDLGGIQARKINYFPESGRVARFLFEPTSDHELSEQERVLMKKTETPETDDVELFV